MTEVETWPIQSNHIEQGEILPGRYKCNFTSIRVVQVDGRDYQTKQLTGKKEPRIVFEFEPVGMETKVINGKKIRYSLSRFFKPSNSSKSALYKFMASMTEEGVIGEATRKDVKAYQALAKSMLGKGFLITAAVAAGGTRTRAEAVMPDSSIPFKEPRTTGFEDFPDASEQDEVTNFCYSLGNETDSKKKEQAVNILKAQQAREAQPNYWVTPIKIKELEGYLVPMDLLGDDIPF